MRCNTFFVTVFIAVVSIFLFSGQLSRPFAPPPQSQQRQATPPKPKAVTPHPIPPPATEMSALFYLPEDIQFPEMPPGGSPTITLFGDPKKEGLYVSRTLIPQGTKTIPHFHSDSRTVTILSGMCYYGRGEEFDESKVILMPPGSFFTEPAGVPHYIWAKEGDVIVQTTAIGPSSTQLVPAKRGETAR